MPQPSEIVRRKNDYINSQTPRRQKDLLGRIAISQTCLGVRVLGTDDIVQRQQAQFREI
jgi:hypothetical protein